MLLLVCLVEHSEKNKSCTDDLLRPGTKALSKQEGPKICCDARFLNPFFEFESAACCKERIKKKGIPTKVWSFLFCYGFSVLHCCVDPGLLRVKRLGQQHTV